MKSLREILLALLACGALAGCGDAPTAPAGAGVDLAAWQPQRAPAIGTLRARATSAAVHFDIGFSGPQSMVPPFGPERAGGWAFQLFLDTDGRPGGYAGGQDYLVRAIEVSPEGRVHVRRTLGGGGPGGWGESVGRVTLSLRSDGMSFAVPLAMLAEEDGELTFTLETYATVEKQTDDGVILTHEFVGGWQGRSSTLGGAVALTPTRKSVTGGGAGMQ